MWHQGKGNKAVIFGERKYWQSLGYFVLSHFSFSLPHSNFVFTSWYTQGTIHFRHINTTVRAEEERRKRNEEGKKEIMGLRGKGGRKEKEKRERDKEILWVNLTQVVMLCWREREGEKKMCITLEKVGKLNNKNIIYKAR